MHRVLALVAQKGKAVTEKTTKKIQFDGDGAALCGELDENVRFIEKECGVSLRLVSSGVELVGEQECVDKATRLINALSVLLSRGEELSRKVVAHTLSLVESGQADNLEEVYGAVAGVTSRGKKMRVKSPGQLAYVNAIKSNTVVIAVGPAGTGKTFLAVARAVSALRAGEVSKIILTRPAIEAGEKLGYLPGDLQMKVDPYLRPLYDSLEELMGESYLRLIERGVLEIAPLAYMRGRTLKSAFVILDEAQNTTQEQMKMFLTRLGEGSRMVVEGDATQIDLPVGKRSGLLDAADKLKNIDGIAVVRLGDTDVVRHELVQKIVNAYEKSDKGDQTSDGKSGN